MEDLPIVIAFDIKLKTCHLQKPIIFNDLNRKTDTRAVFISTAC
jgi:hypothetical protein